MLEIETIMHVAENLKFVTLSPGLLGRTSELHELGLAFENSSATFSGLNYSRLGCCFSGCLKKRKNTHYSRCRYHVDWKQSII